MKKLILSSVLALAAVPAFAGTFMIQGTEYSYDELIRKEIGPGVIYHRLRIPDFPLNVNYLEIDMNNPYNGIENQVTYNSKYGEETTGLTEGLVSAYNRLKAGGKKPLGAANANFWCVQGQAHFTTFCNTTAFNAHLKNGKPVHETNCTTDIWAWGPHWTPVAGIDENKKLYIEPMSWSGYVSSPRWGDGVKHYFDLINKFCRSNTELSGAGQMAMYNSYYGRNKTFITAEFYSNNGNLAWREIPGNTCEVYVNFDDGVEWRTNRDLVGTVMEVKNEGLVSGSLGDYDYCVTGSGPYRNALAQLQPGDKITLNNGWKSYHDGTTPNLMNAVGGSSMVQYKGEHYKIEPAPGAGVVDPNEFDSYNSMTYSRCHYAMNEDGSKLFMLVIDKSTDPVYGTSAGCNTSVSCDILTALGAYNVANMDAGGSAQLMVEGVIVNKTTEASPRAVNNGWVVFSTAPTDEKTNVVARLEFLDYDLNLPIYTSYTPTILAYNEYGELINDNVEGFTLECDPAYGEIVGNKLNLLGNHGETTLTVKYEGVSKTVPLKVIDAPVNFRLPVIHIDGREYPIEIYATLNFVQYPCDPARLTWTVSDEAVATVTNGVLKGLSNGTCTITGTIGDFSTSATVYVEIADETAKPVYTTFPTDAKLTQVGGTGIALSQDGDAATLTFTGNGSSRGAYIAVNRSTQIFGLPYAIRVKVNPGDAEIKKVSFTAKNALEGNYASHTMSEETLPKNTETVLELPLSDWCNPNDIGIYPIEFTELRFGMGASAKGTQFTIKYELEALYESNGGITAATIASNNLKLYPNPVATSNVTLRLADTAQAQIAVYNAAGAKVLDRAADFSGGAYSMNVADLAPGLYFVRVKTDAGVEVTRMIVK